MKKNLVIAAMLTTALFASSVTPAASYQDRAMATGAIFGGATGAAIGSGTNQAVEGAIFGAVFGTIAGAIIADHHQPEYVVYHHPRPYRKHVIHRHRYYGHKAHHYRHDDYRHRHKVGRYAHYRQGPSCDP